MNPFTWSDNEHSVGFPEIDADHKALFHIAEQLYDAIGNGSALDGLDGLLERLTSFANFHFETEESLMLRTGFPKYAQHRQEHESFAANISYIKTLSRSGSADAAEKLMQFLRSWLERHTCGEDHRMVEHWKRVERIKDVRKAKGD